MGITSCTLVIISQRLESWEGPIAEGVHSAHLVGSSETMQTNMSGAVGAPANVGKTATTSASATDSKAVTKRSVYISLVFFLISLLASSLFPLCRLDPFLER
jgi:hypothetical protein